MSDALTKDLVRFIHAQYPGGSGPIPLHAPQFSGNERKYLMDCIDSTFVSTVGEYTRKVEAEINRQTGSAHSLVVVNGTAGLIVALRGVGVEAGDEVITQALTFVATANAISLHGAYPIFLDSAEHSLSLSPAALEKFLRENTERTAEGPKNRKTGRRIRAVVLMHTFGHPGAIREISAICREHGVAFVEDAAESLGSTYHGRHTGVFGDIGVVSFNGNKIATAGGGGALMMQDQKTADHLRHLTTTAKRPHPYEFFHDEVAYNFRMPNLNAALLLGQLERVPEFVEKKRSLAGRYRDFFRGTPYRFVDEPSDTRSNFWLNAVVCPSADSRRSMLEECGKAGIQARPLWVPMHQLPMFSSAERTELPVTEDLYQRVVCFPSSVPTSSGATS